MIGHCAVEFNLCTYLINKNRINFNISVDHRSVVGITLRLSTIINHTKLLILKIRLSVDGPASLFSRTSMRAAILCIMATVIANSSYAQTRGTVAAEMKRSMVDELMKPWYPKAIDTADGGFLSSFTYDFKPTGNQDKMIVTQARHVWSNAKAAELYPQVKYYADGARHGYEFLRDKLWDKQYGGFYTFTDKKGEPKKGNFAPKEAYGNAFAIYALAAYYQQSGDTAALNLAKREFWWLEKHSHDPVNKGYYQHMELDGTPIKRPDGLQPRVELGYKDQNTSIHVLEAFTELYQVWPDDLLKERLQEMLDLLMQKIIHPKGYLMLFFQPDWTPVSLRDSSMAVLEKNRSIDHVSFGHDVETAYLMLEAAHVLDMNDNSQVMALGKKMVDHALDNGWDNKVGGFYDEGYYLKDKPGMTILADTKNWWAQAEGMNTLLLMSDHFPNDRHQYYQKFLQLWDYTKTYLIDHENGDWYQGGLDKQPQYKLALKGQIWKGTYHTFRAFMNCVARLEPDKLPPSLPSKLKMVRKGKNVHLSWAHSKDNKQVLGYNIFSNGKRTAFTPLTAFTILNLKAAKSTRITIEAIDLEGNISKLVIFK